MATRHNHRATGPAVAVAVECQIILSKIRWHLESLIWNAEKIQQNTEEISDEIACIPNDETKH